MTQGASDQLTEAIRAYTAARLKREELEQPFKDSEDAEDAAVLDLYDAMESMPEPLTSMKIDGIGRLTRTLKGPYCRIGEADEDPTADLNEEARARFEAWAKRNNLFDVLIKPMPIYPRLNSVYRKAVNEGTEIPDGVLARYKKSITWADRTKR